MLNLNGKKSHYVIISAYKSEYETQKNDERNSLLEDSLFRREYRLIKLGGVNGDEESVSFIAFKDTEPISNDEIRYDVIELMDQFEQTESIIKYLGEETPTKITNSGSEIPMGLVKYDSIDSTSSYFHNGNSFSFSEQKRYYKPTKLNDFKEGMVIEYFNDNKIWVEKTVESPVNEFNSMYKLLMKYDRIRCSFNVS